MANGSLLLDTTVVIDFLRADPQTVRLLSQGRQIHLSVVVVGELLYGASLAKRSKENTAAVADFVSRCVVLPVTSETAGEYAQIKRHLKEQGRPIPENDVWIAATALEFGLPLMSGDSHFDSIPGLRRSEK